MAVAMPARHYRIVLAEEPDHSAWNVTVPGLPGCVTFGATQGEALKYAHEAISVWIESLEAHGEPVPPPDADSPVVVVRPAR